MGRNRRDFIVLLGCAAAGWSSAARAQQTLGLIVPQTPLATADEVIE